MRQPTTSTTLIRAEPRRRRWHVLAGVVVLTSAAANAAGAGPVVWVQAGHEAPREPGYRNQTGAASGPFGGEIGFTTRVAARVVANLRRVGVDARRTPGRVAPYGARGAAFISIHHDAPGGAAAVGHAVVGRGENYYRGDGSGVASPVPYPDSVAHRPATLVTPTVQSRSHALAARVSRALAAIHTPQNGARGRFAGLVPPNGNPRVMHFHGYYRTNADARILVECGAAGADDAFLRKTDLIAARLAGAIVADLRARGMLPRGAETDANA